MTNLLLETIDSVLKLMDFAPKMMGFEEAEGSDKTTTEPEDVDAELGKGWKRYAFNALFLLKNDDFLLKNGDFIMKMTGRRDRRRSGRFALKLMNLH